MDGTRLRARTVVNAAGLHAPALAARFAGLACSMCPRRFMPRATIFTLMGRRLSVTDLPGARGGWVGVHLTLDLGGQAKFGPDVQWVDSPDDLQVDPRAARCLLCRVRKYWPGLQDGAMAPGYAGMRPKIHGPDAPAADFVIQAHRAWSGGAGQPVWHRSPGLTGALAIAERNGCAGLICDKPFAINVTSCVPVLVSARMANGAHQSSTLACGFPHHFWHYTERFV